MNFKKIASSLHIIKRLKVKNKERERITMKGERTRARGERTAGRLRN